MKNGLTKITIRKHPLAIRWGRPIFSIKARSIFSILVGLCLGHDLLIQKNLNSDFTTFIVKDRVFYHNPILALGEGNPPEDLFLEQLPSDFSLIKAVELREKLQSPEYINQTYILDLRSEREYLTEHIESAVNCLLKDLPNNYKGLLKDKSKAVIVYCNGGIQSVYAVIYLMLKGYKKVKSLSGGYSSYQTY